MRQPKDSCRDNTFAESFTARDDPSASVIVDSAQSDQLHFITNKKAHHTVGFLLNQEASDNVVNMLNAYAQTNHLYFHAGFL